MNIDNKLIAKCSNQNETQYQIALKVLLQLYDMRVLLKISMIEIRSKYRIIDKLYNIAKVIIQM